MLFNTRDGRGEELDVDLTFAGQNYAIQQTKPVIAFQFANG